MKNILLRLGCDEDLSLNVKELQGLLSLQQDGIFGKQTDNFLRDFQASHGLTADGIAGVKTIAKLQEVKAQNKLPDYIYTTKRTDGKWKLSKRSLDKLQGVHPKLVEVIMRSIANSPFDFGITEGVRTVAQQQIYFNQKKSLTMKSRHIPSSNASGMSEAVDIVVYVNGKVNWDLPNYKTVSEHIKAVARELGTPIEWGGDWPKLRDGPHFQLKR